MNLFEASIIVNILIPIIGLCFLIAVIVMYIKTYIRIKAIAELSEINIRNLNLIVEKIETINIRLKEQKVYNRVSYEQYYYDHCFMNNLGPHEWTASGNQSEYDFQFICLKCGQTINVPKHLFPEHPVKLEIKTLDKKPN